MLINLKKTEQNKGEICVDNRDASGYNYLPSGQIAAGLGGGIKNEGRRWREAPQVLTAGKRQEPQVSGG